MGFTIKRLPDIDGSDLEGPSNNAVEGGFTDVEAQIDGSMDEPTRVPEMASDEVPEYEITSGGASETWDPSKANEGPTMDPLSLAKLRLQQLTVAKRILKRDKRALMLDEHHEKKVAKGRRKRALQKASRKRNRR